MHDALLLAVRHPAGCWGWAGRVDARGRPRVQVGRRDLLARRASWEIHHGPIPPKMLVLHDGPSLVCVRPDHLYLGTYRDKTAATMRPVTERYWEKVLRNDEGCWGWTGSTTTFGYGRLQQGRREDPVLLAHRVSWEIHHGPIPEGMEVLHRCDNPPCTRPDHLYLGTQSENMRDAWERTRRGR